MAPRLGGVRLKSSIGDIMLKDMLAGRQQEIHAERELAAYITSGGRWPNGVRFCLLRGLFGHLAPTDVGMSVG